MRFIKDICDIQSRLVQVKYDGLWNDGRGGTLHEFTVSSLSRPGMNHYVQIKIGEKFNKMVNVTPKQCLEQGLVKAYSSDEWYKYACQYNCTMMNSALYPEFRRPTTPEHDYVCSHTLLAVLDVICRMGPGALKENFNKVVMWNDEEKCYK